MMVGVDFQVRPAALADQRQIANLMHFGPFVHRHLDWRYPLDWIGTPPFYVLENQGLVSAVLACPPDPPLVAWVRLFVNSGKIPIQESWDRLWDAVCLDLSPKSRTIIAAIILQDWLPELLLASGFTNHQSIVMLERDEQVPVGVVLPAGFSIRPMLQNDLPLVADVDAASFDLLWQNSLQALQYAYPQAIFPTVVEMEGQVVGYQLSTRNPLGAHLARLAVRPSTQGQGLGRALVADLIQQIGHHGMSRLTVNTQSDNAASLALYRKIGFRETGERFPVYQLQVP
jgi:ribosomal-protein-alanine N-acetyltransferase